MLTPVKIDVLPTEMQNCANPTAGSEGQVECQTNRSDTSGPTARKEAEKFSVACGRLGLAFFATVTSRRGSGPVRHLCLLRPS